MSLSTRCRCGIDTHTHVVPHRFPPYTGKAKDVRWPSMTDAPQCHRHVMFGANIYRTVSDQCWEPEVRLADMDRSNVERQVLSPMPELLCYWLDACEGAAMSSFINESIAQMVSVAPQRFSGLGSVPLQDVDTAIVELDRAVRQFGLAGVEIGSNVNEIPLGDPRLLPFFEAAAEMGAAIFVHALRPAGMNRLVGPAFLEQTVAFPGEVGLSAMSLVTGGTLARLPHLRIAFSHGGGSIGVLATRLQHAWQTMPKVREHLEQAPLELVRKLFFDDLLYDERAIRLLLALVGDEQVMLGSDYPFAIMDPDPVQRATALALSATGLDRLLHANAKRWLGLA